MDIKLIIKWALKRWWWFAVSVAICVTIGLVYYALATPKYDVNATLMLRKASNQGGQDEMMKMMGFGGDKVAGDEIKILTSNDLMGRVVDQLNLGTVYAKKDKLRYKQQYPEHDITVTMAQPVEKSVVIWLTVNKKGYSVRVKTANGTEQFTLSGANQTINTNAGEMQINVPATISDGKYRVVITPRSMVIREILKGINVNRLSRESNIITFSSQSTCPQRSVDIINTLLTLYNQESVTDKNILAVQTEQFLAERIAVVERELNESEQALQDYKRAYQISDLGKTALNYQEMQDEYDQQVAAIDANISVLDFVLMQLNKPENHYAMIPSSFGDDNKNLDYMIQDYNGHAAYRNTLLQMATPENKVIVEKNKLLDQKLVAIKDAILQNRQTLELRRQAALAQKAEYTNRLTALPETERRYVEMCREKATKENQYLYLIEKREENALLLASEAVPAKVVDHAQQAPLPAQPKLAHVGLIAILLGLILPFLVYLFELFRKEYL